MPGVNGLDDNTGSRASVERVAATIERTATVLLYSRAGQAWLCSRLVVLALI